MTIEKITKEEKKQLIQKRIELIDKDKQYAREIFETYFSDPIEVNMLEWEESDYDKKTKIVKTIIKQENKYMIETATAMHGRLNIKKIMREVIKLKDEQLKRFGIR